jgi:hypothetical protein
MDRVSLLSTLCQLECELHQPKCRGDRERLAQLLAPDFREFGRSGALYTRDRMLMSLPIDPEPPQIHAQNFAVNQLSNSIALLTYRSAHVNPSGELYFIRARPQILLTNRQPNNLKTINNRRLHHEGYGSSQSHSRL